MPLTVRPNPTFYVYVPESSSVRYEFALFDGRSPVYKVELEPVATAGIIRIALPETVTLEAGAVDGEPKTYQWFLSMVCDVDDRSRDVTTNGWVHRVNTALTETTAQALAESGYV